MKKIMLGMLVLMLSVNITSMAALKKPVTQQATTLKATQKKPVASDEAKKAAYADQQKEQKNRAKAVKAAGADGSIDDEALQKSMKATKIADEKEKNKRQMAGAIKN